MRTVRSIWITLLAAISVLASVPSAPWAPARVVTASMLAQDDEPVAVDRLVLRNGRVIEGRILSQTSTSVEILVIVAGISAPTTYPMSDILSIARGVNEQPVATDIPKRRTEPRATQSTPDSSAPRDGAKRIYIMNLRGNLGREISKTPLENAVNDAVADDPDVIVVRIDAGSAVKGFDGFFTAEALAPILRERIDEGRRVVFWVKRAQSGAAFLPLISPEIYFMSDGTLGGVGNLNSFDIGDDVVNLKQISLRLGHAEGMAITGGYEPKLIRAMAILEDWLAVRWRGGRPEYMTWEPRPEDGEGWVVLTDDGKGKNKDEFSFEGNDLLTIDADLAFRLLIAKGVVDTLDDLVFELNIGRDYVVLDGKSDKIFADWRDGVNRAEDQINRLREELNSRGGRRTTADAGKQMNALRQLRGLISSYEEVFDPSGAARAAIDVQIEERREAIRNASQRRR